jgi:radical SAM protein with 4Fe4S-binding SPASM domain
LWADSQWGGELEFLTGLEVPFHLDTNGVCLSDERAAKLVDSRLSWLNVSLDAAEARTYARIRRGSPDLEEVVKNVANLVRRRDCGPTRKAILISISFTLMRSNLAELAAFIELGASLGVDLIACRHLDVCTPEMAADSLWLDRERFNRVREEALGLARAREVRLAIPEPFVDRPSVVGHRPCSAPWHEVVILGDGDVQVCCVPGTKIGNLYDEDMEAIWSGARYGAFRTAVNSGRSPTCCDSCAYVRRPGNRASYFPYERLREGLLDYWH